MDCVGKSDCSNQHLDGRNAFNREMIRNVDCVGKSDCSKKKEYQHPTDDTKMRLIHSAVSIVAAAAA